MNKIIVKLINFIESGKLFKSDIDALLRLTGEELHFLARLLRQKVAQESNEQERLMLAHHKARIELTLSIKKTLSQGWYKEVGV